MIFKDLVQLKAAVTRATGHGGATTHEARVYEWIHDEWVQCYEIPVGIVPKKDHILWKTSAKPGSKRVALPQKHVDAAIESIMASIQGES